MLKPGFHFSSRLQWQMVMVAIFHLPFCLNLPAQMQIGGDIFGSSAGDQSGFSVSLSKDGNRLAIGAPYVLNSNGISTGQVRIFEWKDGHWEQIGQDIVGTTIGSSAGVSVSLSSDGNRLAYGDTWGPERVFEFKSGTWVQLGADVGPSPSMLAEVAGISVSLSSDGERLAVGAWRNSNAGEDTGTTRMYELIDGAWVQLGGDINGDTAGDESGFSVSLSSAGTRVAIGAPGGGLEGRVRVFEFIAGEWEQVGADINGESAFDYSGHAVSLSSDGNRVAIGAYGNDDNGFWAGHVRIFELTGNTWKQLGTDIDGEKPGDESGNRSIALSSNGQRVAIGSRINFGGRGHVRLFEFDGENWVKVGSTINGEAIGDFFGNAVSLSSDGSKMAIGAPGQGAGHVSVYGIDPVGVENKPEDSKIVISPNPTAGIILIKGKTSAETILRVTDTRGIIIQKQTVELPFEVDLRDSPGGLYFITIENECYSRTERIIKM